MKYYTSYDSGEPTLSCQRSVKSKSCISFVWAYHIAKKRDNAQWKKLLFCWITPKSRRKFLFFQCGKLHSGVLKLCEVWWKFTFSSVSYSHLFAYYPGCYLVDSVTTCKFCCSLYLWSISPLKVNFKVLHIIYRQDLKSALNIAQAPFKVPLKAES